MTGGYRRRPRRDDYEDDYYPPRDEPRFGSYRDNDTHVLPREGLFPEFEPERPEYRAPSYPPRPPVEPRHYYPPEPAYEQGYHDYDGYAEYEEAEPFPPVPVVSVDVCAPLRSNLVPFAQLIVVTGLLWMAIGAVDRIPPVFNFPPYTHNLLVVVWLVLSVLVFVVPLVKDRRRRLMLIDDQLVLKNWHGRGRDVVELKHLSSVSYRRKNLYLRMWGRPEQIVIKDVPMTKKVMAAIEKQMGAR